MYYVRATDNNRYGGGGTSRWLKIRSIRKLKKGYEIQVRINWYNKYVYVSEKHHHNLEFAKGWPGLMPMSLITMLEDYYRREGTTDN